MTAPNFFLFSALKVLGVFSVLMFIVAYAVWVERKVSASIQDRRGPNRVGTFGLLQPLADMIKTFLKEDFTPAHVRKTYFWGMSVVPIFLIVGNLNLSAVVHYQSGGLFHWLIFKQPIAFGIFVAAMFAETNRLPFDLPESEQELAGGYNVEYSSMKFALFFLGEYAAMTTASALLVTLFLGGWSLPFAGLDQPAINNIPMGLLHIGIFLTKMLIVEFMIIWVRWMWPRFRYDQLMDLGWRRFIPLALANIVVTALVILTITK